MEMQGNQKRQQFNATEGGKSQRWLHDIRVAKLLALLIAEGSEGGSAVQPRINLEIIILGYRCTFVPMPYTEIHSTYIVSCTDSQFSVVQVQFTLH